MGILKFYAKNKQTILPWVKDWTDPQDQIRYEKDLSKLTNAEWLWCHPSGHKLSHYLSYILGALISLCLLLFIDHNYFTFVLTAIIFFVYCFIIYQRYRKFKDQKMEEVTLYDLYMREYK